MKLEEFADKAIDQNEVASNYLWLWAGNNESPIYRISLSSQKIDFSKKFFDFPYIKHLQILPNNTNFGVYANLSQYLSTIDDNFNIKYIDLPKHNDIFGLNPIDIASRFYDDSIFLFEYGSVYHRENSEDGISDFYVFKRYSLTQNKWWSLANPPFYSVASCIGFNQKILISDENPGIWVYDIILDTYSQFCTNIFKKYSSRIFIKDSGKVYIIDQSTPYSIYSCEGNISDWTFVHKSNSFGISFYDKFFYFAYYEGSIYYLSNFMLFKFDLKELKLTKLTNFNSIR